MTDEEIGYRRINAGIFKFSNYSKLIDGMIKFNPYFIEHIQDAADMFKKMFQDRIIDAIGDRGWAIYFVQIDPHTNSYFCDIFVDDINNFQIVVGIINGKIHKDFHLTFMYRGNVNDYIHNQ